MQAHKAASSLKSAKHTVDLKLRELHNLRMSSPNLCTKLDVHSA